MEGQVRRVRVEGRGVSPERAVDGFVFAGSRVTAERREVWIVRLERVVVWDRGCGSGRRGWCGRRRFVAAVASDDRNESCDRNGPTSFRGCGVRGFGRVRKVEAAAGRARQESTSVRADGGGVPGCRSVFRAGSGPSSSPPPGLRSTSCSNSGPHGKLRDGAGGRCWPDVPGGLRRRHPVDGTRWMAPGRWRPGRVARVVARGRWHPKVGCGARSGGTRSCRSLLVRSSGGHRGPTERSLVRR